MDPKASNDELENGITEKLFNDIIVNQYLELVTKLSPKTLYVFNTHFFTTFFEKGYQRIHRWTKNINIFSKERLFIPIHCKSNGMWGLVYVDFIEKSILYCDSRRTNGIKYQKLVTKYLKLEHLMRKGKSFTTNGWNYITLCEPNYDHMTWDSGLFLCVVAQHIAQNTMADLIFSNQFMNFSPDYIGCEKMVLEKILSQIKRNSIK